jgi:hypothetical protein
VSDPTLAPELSADIRWALPPVPRLTARPVLALVAASLPAIEDDLTADLLERVSLELMDREDDRAALRELLHVALERLHEAQRTIRRLEGRRDGLIEEIRALVGAERAPEGQAI